MQYYIKSPTKVSDGKHDGTRCGAAAVCSIGRCDTPLTRYATVRLCNRCRRIERPGSRVRENNNNSVPIRRAIRARSNRSAAPGGTSRRWRRCRTKRTKVMCLHNNYYYMMMSGEKEASRCNR